MVVAKAATEMEPRMAALVFVPEPSPGLPPPESLLSQPDTPRTSNAMAVKPKMLRINFMDFI